MPPARAAEVMSWELMCPTQFAIMSRLARMVIVDGASGKLPSDDVTNDLPQFFNRVGQFVNFGLKVFDASHR